VNRKSEVCTRLPALLMWLQAGKFHEMDLASLHYSKAVNHV